jgi:arabinan endo-1,5-alpha-L-arabinosidase
MLDFVYKKLLLLALIAFCAVSVSAQKAQKQAEVYLNPVFNADFPDPTLVRAKDGNFYAYATQAEVNGKTLNIQVARSGDLVNWQHLGDALPEKPVWANQTQNFWAPHVSEADGKYFLYYSAEPNKKANPSPQDGLCLAAAVADKPEGPFKDIGKPMKCGEGFVNIDPMQFDDPLTGKRLLYWGSGFQPIKVQELAANRIEFAPNSQPIDLIAVHKTEDLNDYQRLVEGAWVIYRKPYYYLFYSGDNCCGEKAHYAAMVARSKSATGPFETLAQATGKANSVILEKNDEWLAPGHNSVIQDDDGQDWIFYHAINVKARNEAKAKNPGKEPEVGRVMLMNKLVYKNGWVMTESGTPAIKLNRLPKINKRKNR